MLQTLLADRFKLRISKETREVQGYGLIVDKSGPRLREAATEEALVFKEKNALGRVERTIRGKASLKDFAEFLSSRPPFAIQLQFYAPTAG
jgi:uncharacterized protein (TIGR03435 family)